MLISPLTIAAGIKEWIKISILKHACLYKIKILRPWEISLTRIRIWDCKIHENQDHTILFFWLNNFNYFSLCYILVHMIRTLPWHHSWDSLLIQTLSPRPFLLSRVLIWRCWVCYMSRHTYGAKDAVAFSSLNGFSTEEEENNSECLNNYPRSMTECGVQLLEMQTWMWYQVAITYPGREKNVQLGLSILAMPCSSISPI